MDTQQSHQRLSEIRQQIDQLDQQIIQLIAKRFVLTREIGQIKNQLQLTSITNERYQSVVTAWQQQATAHGLAPQFAAQLFDMIHSQVIAEHDLIKQQAK